MKEIRVVSISSKRLLVIVVILSLTLLVISIINWNLSGHYRQNVLYVYSNQEYLFGDNITGFSENVVPNIVHYVLFGVKEIQFGHFISILSVIRNHKPEIIMIHCDCNKLIGDYYKRVLKISNKTKTKIIVRTVIKPTKIFGKRISKQYLNWHSSDITRIEVLMNFGGIYLDRDTYVVKPLHNFRKYEMTLEWDEAKERNMYIHVLIANRNARFLRLWLDSYRLYDPNQWFLSSGILPTKLFLHKTPHIVHRVKLEFGGYGPTVCPKLYKTYYSDWQKDYFALHLAIRNEEIGDKQWCFGNDTKNYPLVIKFNENIVRKLNTTFGEMTRLVLDYENNII